MTTNFERVGDFLEKFDLPRFTGGRAHTVDDKTFLFRFQHMGEEMNEMIDAHRKDDVIQLADALADLLYLVYGTAHFCNIPIDAVFREVHRANMTKVRATNTDNKRGSNIDVVKPHGWTPPAIDRVLKEAE